MPPPLTDVIRQLVKRYGRLPPPKVTDPFQMIVWENAAYLVDDERRNEAFEQLRRTAGLTPRGIADAPQKILLESARLGGMFPEKRVERLRFSAQLTLDQFNGELRGALRLPLSKARKALKIYPTIGDP